MYHEFFIIVFELFFYDLLYIIFMSFECAAKLFLKIFLLLHIIYLYNYSYNIDIYQKLNVIQCIKKTVVITS